jgi:hypothetical protein
LERDKGFNSQEQRMSKKAEGLARPRVNKRNRGNGKEEKIAAVIAELDQIKPRSAKTARALKLLKSWLNDDSGYDEEVWPHLRTALEQERERVGARRLFDA